MTIDEDLIPRARAGDRAALNTALAHCRPALLAFVRVRLPPHLRAEVAEEIVQEACLLASRKIEDFREGTLDGFRAWLRSFAAFGLADWRKRVTRLRRDYRRVLGQQASEPTGSQPGLLEREARHEDTPSREARRGEREALLLRTMETVLTAWEQAAVRLYHLEGLRVTEVAALLGCNTSAVKTACWRARKKLRDALGRPSHFLSVG